MFRISKLPTVAGWRRGVVRSANFTNNGANCVRLLRAERHATSPPAASAWSSSSSLLMGRSGGSSRKRRTQLAATLPSDRGRCETKSKKAPSTLNDTANDIEFNLQARALGARCTTYKPAHYKPAH